MIFLLEVRSYQYILSILLLFLVLQTETFSIGSRVKFSNHIKKEYIGRQNRESFNRLYLKREESGNNPRDDDDYDEEYEDEIDRRMNERFANLNNNNSGNKKRPKKSKVVIKDLNKWEVVNRAVLAGVFVAGIGSGITIDSAINTNPRDLASR